MENYRFTDLVTMIGSTRDSIPYSMPLHLFGAGHPLTMALSIALGCDTFDSASYILFARQGRYMTQQGILKLDQMTYLPCSCPACTKTSVRELIDMEPGEKSRSIASHNLYLLKTEIDVCKEAIMEGRLWDLVGERASGHPRLYEAFGKFAKRAEKMRDGTPTLKAHGLFIRGETDLLRPELSSARRKLSGAMSMKNRAALLVMGGEAFPSTRLDLSGVPNSSLGACDIYRSHGVMGVYPIELDFVYPFTQMISAIQPRGTVSERIRKEKKRLAALGYRRILIARVDNKGRAYQLRFKNRPKRTDASPYPPST
jgi:7-cyano-7-deazaguanine tRNA-ribosyltransferase